MNLIFTISGGIFRCAVKIFTYFNITIIDGIIKLAVSVSEFGVFLTGTFSLLSSVSRVSHDSPEVLESTREDAPAARFANRRLRMLMLRR